MTTPTFTLARFLAAIMLSVVLALAVASFYL